jgi:hypothetical protein
MFERGAHPANLLYRLIPFRAGYDYSNPVLPRIGMIPQLRRFDFRYIFGQQKLASGDISPYTWDCNTSQPIGTLRKSYEPP